MEMKFDDNWEGKKDNMVHETKRIRAAGFETSDLRITEGGPTIHSSVMSLFLNIQNVLRVKDFI